MSKLKIKIREATKKSTTKSYTLTPEEISAIEAACSKHDMKCKPSTDSGFVAIWHNGEEVYVEPRDEYGNGLVITMGVEVYGGMDQHSWATPELTLNTLYADYSSNDVTEIISTLIDNVYGLLEAREKTRTCIHYITR